MHSDLDEHNASQQQDSRTKALSHPYTSEQEKTQKVPPASQPGHNEHLLLVGDSGPVGIDECASATTLTLTTGGDGGRLDSNGSPVVTGQDMTFVALSPLDVPPGGDIATSFTLLGDELAWINPSFFGGRAGFCLDDQNVLYATFTDPDGTDYPLNCFATRLFAVSTDIVSAILDAFVEAIISAVLEPFIDAFIDAFIDTIFSTVLDAVIDAILDTFTAPLVSAILHTSLVWPPLARPLISPAVGSTVHGLVCRLIGTTIDTALVRLLLHALLGLAIPVPVSAGIALHRSGNLAAGLRAGSPSVPPHPPYNPPSPTRGAGSTTKETETGTVSALPTAVDTSTTTAKPAASTKPVVVHGTLTLPPGVYTTPVASGVCRVVTRSWIEGETTFLGEPRPTAACCGGS
ncbi:hypothetical protein VdG1_00439 [Verticillium dahliae VDG1]|nr:hypothetical protein VdG1_00439 [Verticillium dahliae VDG1]